jgi:DNA-binding IclR family transcriptional regulator
MPLRRPTQAEYLRRGLTAVALLRTEPRRVSDLVAALDLEEREVLRMLGSLRSEGLAIQTEARGRERWHSVTEVPEWMDRAIRQIAARELPRARRR